MLFGYCYGSGKRTFTHDIMPPLYYHTTTMQTADEGHEVIVNIGSTIIGSQCVLKLIEPKSNEAVIKYQKLDEKGKKAASLCLQSRGAE